MRGSATRPRTAGRRGDGGFTIIELMIALTVLIIGITGILAMQITGMRASSYSRHATEASVLAEDKMEALRTVPLASVVDGTETGLDEQGSVPAAPDPPGLYTRDWTIANGTSYATITVTVSWLERGAEAHSITMSTMRAYP